MKKLFLPLILFSSLSFAQITEQGEIFSQTHRLNNNIPVIEMPQFDIEALKAEDEINDQKITKPFRFGKNFIVNYSPTTHGKWVNLPNGDRIWRLKITSDHAKTLNFLLKNYRLSKNAKLYLHNEEGQFLGYYTSNENTKEKQVATWPIDGSSITIEFYEPANEAGLSTFEIAEVVHGYRTVNNIQNPIKGLNTSGNCNVDVNCAAGDDWEQQKKSVALILSGTTEWCTGTLVNNTALDGTPYFLTANHCYTSSTPAWTFRFKWISENPDCATSAPSGDGPRIFSLSGAEIKARNAGTDMMLLELTSEIPVDWELVWSGWDRSGNIPNNATGLHHPDGDIMKIAQYYSSPLKKNRSGIAAWEIPAWDLGVTEGGSSGSGLFDHNGRIIGQLYGGYAACSGTSPNNQYDIYGRIDTSWEGGGSPNTRLKDWLDPRNSQEMTTDHFVKELLQNDIKINSITAVADCDGNISPSIEIKNSGTEIIQNYQLKYKFNDETESVISFDTPLNSGQTTTVYLENRTFEAGDHTFQSELLVDGDQNVYNNISTANFSVLETLQTNKVTLNLTTDNYANENAWYLYNSQNQIVQSGENLTNNTTYTIDFENLAEDCYRFVLEDSFGDGICCDYGNGSYALTLPTGEVISSGAEFSDEVVVNFRVSGTLGLSNLTTNEVAIYPNPTDNIINLEVNANLGKYTYEIYSALGQKVKQGSGTGNQKVNLKQYGKGNFVIYIKTENGKTITKKIIVK
ncbi:T9SS type A sorting domain-containing protein [Faecalibacter bovis]|uniref:T9SS type A sorting domain-containing protein n=1 Tax=Faecalibacter bovis TaxID=2898187 RepID=A0ABX7XCW5_9FLAO|nr:T9SS type A sorting domain-containing protein [Faecalibacter bovis]QTV05766.1 T9SS type A sorting domain-containing protein [Faecalibacter bovis]